MPFGIVNAANVNTRFDLGDLAGAQRASAEAGKWTKLAFWIGLGLNLLGLIGYLLMMFFFAGASGGWQ